MSGRTKLNGAAAATSVAVLAFVVRRYGWDMDWSYFAWFGVSFTAAATLWSALDETLIDAAGTLPGLDRLRAARLAQAGFWEFWFLMLPVWVLFDSGTAVVERIALYLVLLVVMHLAFALSPRRILPLREVLADIAWALRHSRQNARRT